MEEEFYKMLIQNSAFGYAYHKIILDELGEPIDYQFLEVNTKFRELTGLYSKEIDNKKVSEVIPEIMSDSFNWIKFYGEIALNGGKKEFESYSEVLKKWYKVEASSYKKYYFATFFIDITDRVNLELAKEEIKFQENLLDSVGESIIATDTNGIIKYWNKGAENIYGWREEEALEKNIVKLIGVDNEEIALSRIQSMKLWQGEYILRKKDGTIFPVSVTGSPIFDKNGTLRGRIGISKDITGKKLDEEKLIKINEELKKANLDLKIKSYVVEQSPSAIIITDRKGKIEYINPNFSKITEYTFDEVVGQTPKLLNSGYHSKEFYENMWSTIISGEIWSGEILNKNKSGNLYWEYALISGVKDDNGEITHFVAVKDNITELKKANEEIVKAKREAEEANNAKSIFLANISHEIRTPLNSIIGFSQLLDRDKNLSDVQKSYSEIIIKSGEHLLEIINSILEISKIESGKIYFNNKNFDLFDTIDNIYKMFKERCAIKNIKLTFNQSNNILRYVFMDESKVKQIFINLIGNAIKFTSNGEINVRLSGYKGIENRFYLKAEIEDTGEGIAENEIGKLFKFFEQTESGIVKGSGTGIGLAISKKLIELMGGNITVSSEVGKGTIFKFEIELNEGEKEKIEKSIVDRVVMVKANDKKCKILIVDDNYLNLFAMVELLRSVGFETYQALDGKSAIEKAILYTPDLILMDVRMPGIDGYEAIEKIRENESTKDTPIIVMTADVFEENIKNTTQYGANGYIRKPFKEHELFQAIKGLLDLRYIYQYNNNEYQENNISLPNKETFESSVKKLTDVELLQLKKYAKSADLDGLLEVINEIGKIDSNLAETLRIYALNYNYDVISNL